MIISAMKDLSGQKIQTIETATMQIPVKRSEFSEMNGVPVPM